MTLALPKRNSGAVRQRLMQIIIDPIIFLIAVTLPFVFLLWAIDKEPVDLFYVFSHANDNFAMSNVIGTIVPLAVVSASTAIGSIVRFFLQLSQNRDRKILEIMDKGDGLFYSLLLILGFGLSFFVVFLLNDFDDLLSQLRPLSGHQYNILWLLTWGCLIASFLISIVLSAKQVVRDQMNAELRANRDEHLRSESLPRIGAVE